MVVNKGILISIYIIDKARHFNPNNFVHLWSNCNIMKIAIIGNGISGITAARHIRKLSNHSIVVISSETDHFYSRTALMYIYMGHMGFKETKPYEDWFWQKNNIQLKRAFVEQINTNKKTLTTAEGENIAYDYRLLFWLEKAAFGTMYCQQENQPSLINIYVNIILICDWV